MKCSYAFLLSIHTFFEFGKHSLEQKVTTSPCLRCLPPALKQIFCDIFLLSFANDFSLSTIHIRQNILAPPLTFGKINQHPPFFLSFTVSLTLVSYLLYSSYSASVTIPGLFTLPALFLFGCFSVSSDTGSSAG